MPTGNPGEPRPGRRVDLAGRRFGRLLVVERAASVDGRLSRMWLCRCDCGTEKLVDHTALQGSPGTRSCGCSKFGAHRDLPANSLGWVPLQLNDAHEFKHAIVDPEDCARVARLRWHVAGPGYVYGHCDGWKVVLHRVILGLADDDPREVDHVNGDLADCRRSNLRVVTPAQNCQNKTRLLRNNTSGYRGVSWSKRRRKWLAYATVNEDDPARRLRHRSAHRTAAEADAAVKKWRSIHMPYSADARE